MCLSGRLFRAKNLLGELLLRMQQTKLETDSDKAFIAKSLTNHKRHCLTLLDNDKRTLLYYVCRYEPDCLKNVMPILRADDALGKYSPAIVDQEVLKVDASGDVDAMPLMTLIGYHGRSSQLPDDLALILNKNTLKMLFVRESRCDHAWSFLHYVARYCSDDNFKSVMRLIAGLDKNILSDMLKANKKVSEDSAFLFDTPLEVARSHQSDGTMCWLVNFLEEYNIAISVPPPKLPPLTRATI